MHVAFAKYEGLGNAFLLLDRAGDNGNSPALSPEQVQWLCNPHRGIGADGVILVSPSQNTETIATMELFNADGGRAEISGNGLRCLALWLQHRHRIAEDKPCLIATDAGPRQVSFPPNGIRVEMGHARVQWTRPFSVILNSLDKKVDIGIPFVLQQTSLMTREHPNTTAVTLGNPHVIVHAPETISENLTITVGKACQSSLLFPHGVNVSMYTLVNQTTIELITYERGVGLTPACGSGACAAVAGLIHRNELPIDQEITVRQPGGMLLVRQDATRSLWLTGPARRICEGTAFLSDKA